MNKCVRELDRKTVVLFVHATGFFKTLHQYDNEREKHDIFESVFKKEGVMNQELSCVKEMGDIIRRILVN